MEYYISNNYGSFTGPHLKHQLLSAGLKRDTMVWREGFPTWYPAYQLPELSDIFASTPPPLAATPYTPGNQPPALPASQPAVSTQNIAKQGESPQPHKEIKPAVKTHPKPSVKSAARPVARPAAKPVAKSADKSVAKPATAKKSGSKKDSKTKYDFPVSPWLSESIWLLAFVIIHAILALTDMTTFEYIYLDIVGAVLSITGIVIGLKIKSLNKVSYAKGSDTRNLAEKFSKFNGFLVSATAAAGFLIILYQSAHYVYVC